MRGDLDDAHPGKSKNISCIFMFTHDKISRKTHLPMARRLPLWSAEDDLDREGLKKEEKNNGSHFYEAVA